MAETIKADHVAEFVVEKLLQYTEEIAQKSKKAIDLTAKELQQAVVRDSPRGKKSKRSKRYYQGWKTKVEYEDADSKRIRLRNTDYPTLTWLLEFGHLTKDGKNRLAPQPHILANKVKAIETLKNRIKEAVENG